MNSQASQSEGGIRSVTAVTAVTAVTESVTDEIGAPDFARALGMGLRFSAHP